MKIFLINLIPGIDRNNLRKEKLCIQKCFSNDIKIRYAKIVKCTDLLLLNIKEKASNISRLKNFLSNNNSTGPIVIPKLTTFG